MSRRAGTPPTAATAANSEESPSPLRNNSYPLAPGERRSSNPLFGAIGGPSPTSETPGSPTGGPGFTLPAPPPPPQFLPAVRPAPSLAGMEAPRVLPGGGPGSVLPAPRSQLAPAVRHASRLGLGGSNPAPSSNSRQSPRPNTRSSYSASLTTWRRAPDQPSPLPAPLPAPRPAPAVLPPVARRSFVPLPQERSRVPDPAAQRSFTLPESRSVVGRGGFDGGATAYRGLNAGAPPFQAGGLQQRQMGSQAVTPYRAREPFKPMNATINPWAANLPLTEEDKRYRDAKGISHNYKGDARNPINESANIPDDENCAVWITRLPPRCTIAELLAVVAVHRPGKVYATVISPPTEPTNMEESKLASAFHSAAKIVFYKPEGAKELIRAANRRQFWVNDDNQRPYPPRVIYNKIKVAAQRNQQTTRCVRITGPAHIVNVEALTALFKKYFEWETEVVLVYDSVEPRRKPGPPEQTVEWRFSGHNCQAGSAMRTIQDHCPLARASYSPDPCEQVLIQQMAQLSVQ